MNSKYSCTELSTSQELLSTAGVILELLSPNSSSIKYVYRDNSPSFELYVCSNSPLIHTGENFHVQMIVSFANSDQASFFA